MADDYPSVDRVMGGPAGWISIAFPTILFLYFLRLLPEIAQGPQVYGFDWVPSLGVQLSVLLDGLSMTFALLITGIGAAVTLYSARYLGDHPDYPRFVSYLLMFMVGMLGLVLADNLIMLFVFWEITTIASYLLIGFNADSAASRRSALQALLVTGTGGLILLAGLIVLGTVAGTSQLSQIVTMGDMIRAHPWYLGILLLFLAGAFTKSAQVPFHFWLPNAMAAPTPVSAYLHSATMVKAGVFLMARMNPALGGTDAWFWILTLFGGVTAVFASVMALRQTDIKQVLAYTTLMALGTLTMFIGAGTHYAIVAAMLFLVVHSLYKAALFLMIGIVDHATGTRDAGVLGGLSKAMPLTGLAAALAAISMAGIPPMIGFIGKEFMYKAGLGLDGFGAFWVTAMAFAASVLMFAVGGIVALKPFRGDLRPTPTTPHEGPWAMLAGPLVLGALSLIFGLLPGVLGHYLVGPATHAVFGEVREVHLYLWGGINMALILSLLTFLAGWLVYRRHQAIRDRLAAFEARSPIDFDAGWDRLLDGFKAFAAWQTNLIQTGSLQRYMAVMFATFVVMVGGSYLIKGAFQGVPGLSAEGVHPIQWTVLGLIVAGAILTVWTHSRMTAIAGMGASGIGVSLIFIMFSAPDVAITQLLVEVLVVVLVSVVMLRLPYLPRRSKTRFRTGHAVIAGGAGLVTTFLLMSVMATDFDRRLTSFFEAASYPEAHGRNIVNVILVDFRALDTFGEITVVAIAAIAAFALLRGATRRKPEEES
ncbi:MULTISPECIES: putative monovalent cation/H+ antiporter subunit A [unclassified Paracoccus (in: a-proteobacteria)]|uniref:putative monovalent cation/H+ antiporter subunit A n=1 Tax=unclassified Paracoccus (in: a-proteobacteria) TaxID=2688777 RepID=UPI0020953952|nr:MULTISPECIES: putative monovalent cation/H+ antiporter subunit A [unclassified Paracoccus (in: a-proteobacteria)]MCO6362621.1 putative monovalent cation/H+ antiporter subunit A [Paracoccus sp. 08]